MKFSTVIFYSISVFVLLTLIHFVSAGRVKRYFDFGGQKWAFGCDFDDGGDFKNVRTRGEDCGGLCNSTPGCTHFTWTQYNGGTCWMKKGMFRTTVEAFPTGDKSMVCGFV